MGEDGRLLVRRKAEGNQFSLVVKMMEYGDVTGAMMFYEIIFQCSMPQFAARSAFFRK
ncbi:hypothetical protein [Sphingobacterium lumbrici]|uniref:hypothetical protein n=1 Tax=Sphingobacterium lumbrici TaxID=2559600 RepID=UPI0015E47446|nr:hypothetical protein [Sphingobacterium lumbrici]